MPEPLFVILDAVELHSIALYAVFPLIYGLALRASRVSQLALFDCLESRGAHQIGECRL